MMQLGLCMDLPRPGRLRSQRKYGERFIEAVLLGCAMASIIIMMLIFYFLAREGLRAFMEIGGLNLVLSQKWHPAGDIYGMLPLIINSLLVTALALFINISIGIPLAIYLAELAGPREKDILKPAIELLAGVPSIVYGFMGVIILVSYLQKSFDMLTGRSIIACSILLGVMFIPRMTTICEDALRAVPKEFEEGSLALGANNWQTIRHVTIPAASSGIIAAIILNIGSIIGETMAALLVVGNVAKLPNPIFNIFDQGATFTSVIAGEMGEVARGSLHYQVLFAVGLVLLVVVSILSIMADLLRARIQKKFGGY
jgi:phosphate ABC transporter permease protein PstC